MEGPRTPAGIIVLAGICFLAAGGLVVLGCLLATTPATLRPFGFLAGPDTSTRLRGLGFFGGVGAFVGAEGYGLWRVKRWARATLILQTLGTLIRGGLGVLASASSGSTLNATSALAAVVSVTVLWYLWTPTVRAAFKD